VEARVLSLSGRFPPGGIVLRPPLPEPPPAATIGDVSVPTGPEGEVVVRKIPAVVRWTTRN
jgi:hypothetical protein